MQSLRDTVSAIRGSARHDSIARLADYWVSICPDQGMPGREHFDPVDIPGILPYIVLTDVEHAPLRFRFRLIGTAVVDAINEDLTGRYFDEAVDNYQNSEFYVSRREVVETGSPHYYIGDPPADWSDVFSSQERIYLPLASDGQSVDMILGGVVFNRLDLDSGRAVTTLQGC